MRVTRACLAAICLIALPAAKARVPALQAELAGESLTCRGGGDPFELIFSPDGSVFIDGRRGLAEWAATGAVIRTPARPNDEITVARRGRGVLAAQWAGANYTCSR